MNRVAARSRSTLRVEQAGFPGSFFRGHDRKNLITKEKTAESSTLKRHDTRSRRGQRIFRIIGGILAGSAFLFFLSNGSILSRFIDRPASERPGVNTTGRRIQVSVLNACGAPGIAMKMTDHLRSLGYDVVEIGNYESPKLDRSIVIDWNNDITVAGRIAEAIDIPPERIVRKKGNRELVEFSVVLGKDYRQLTPLR
jgi:hypothetical protein